MSTTGLRYWNATGLFLAFSLACEGARAAAVWALEARRSDPARMTAQRADQPAEREGEYLLGSIPRPQDGGGIAGASYATGFEPAEGFVPGYLRGQQHWETFASSTIEAHIDTADPRTGTQHLRISRDPALPNTSNVGAFSPDLGTFVNTPATVSVWIKVITGGVRDYEVVPQNVTEGLVVTRVRLRSTFDIDVLGPNGAFVDTGFNWEPNVYRNVTINLNLAANTITISYGGQQIFSMPVAFATAVQEVVLFGNNGPAPGENGDFDDFSIAVPPACPWDCGGGGDGSVGIVDFLELLAQWGQVGAACDLDGGGVGITDFLELLGHWGTCP